MYKKGGESVDEINIRFIKVRKALSLTQRGIGDALGLSNSGISNIESGQRNVTDKHLKLLTSIFNVNESWMRTGEGTMFMPKIDGFIDDPSLDVTDREILNSYIRMTPSQRQFIKSWIKNIAATINDNGNDSGHQLTNKEESKDGNWKQRELKAYAKELDAEEKGLSVSGNIDDSSKKRA